MARIEVDEAVDDRFAESLQPGVGELHLRLDAQDSTDAEVRRVVREIVEERRLSDSRFTANHHRAAAALSRHAQRIRQLLALVTTIQDLPLRW